MSRIVTITNVSGSEKTYAGQTIADTETYTLETNEFMLFRDDSNLFTDVADGSAIIGDGSADITDPVKGWGWLYGDSVKAEIAQTSDSLQGKIAVHASTKPQGPDLNTYSVWTGSGDDVSDPDPANHQIGDGPILHFVMTEGTPVVTIEARFSHGRFGRTWIHEGYLKFTNGGAGDYIEAIVCCDGTPLQQAVDLDYNVSGDDWITYAGPGAGTHGLAGLPSLVPRPFMKDGDWDFDGTNLTPNMAGTGGYKMTSIKRGVHKFINKIPCSGTCSSYFSMTSDETAEIPAGFYLEISCHNVSNTAWEASAIFEMYRERTIEP